MTLPDGWRVMTLSEIAQGGIFVDGDWVESKDQDPRGDVRLTQLADVGVGQWRDRSNRWLREDQAARLGCTFLEPNDVLIARMPDPLGRSCLVPATIGRAVTVVDVALLRVRRTDVESTFVSMALNAPRTQSAIEGMQSGTTRKRISRRNLATVSIAVPPLDEQRRIVGILEEHLSSVDAGMSGLGATAQRSARLLERLSVQLLTGGFAASDSWIADYGRDLSPKLPFGWNWVSLSGVSTVVGGVTKDAAKQSEPGLVEVPYLRVANVQRGYLDLTKVTTIRVSQEKANSLRLLDGDVLLNEGGDRNKLARGSIWADEIPNCIHQNHVFRARVDRSKALPEWVSRVANVLGGRWAELHGKQSVNLASISLKTIRAMPIPLPSIDHQVSALAEIADAEVADRRIQNACAAAALRATGLRRALLQAAFSGQLTGRSSDLDRAEELVSRSPTSRR